MTEVKICGISHPTHALMAARHGADFFGLVFVPGVRREITQSRAEEIISAVRYEYGSQPKAVGLFADQSLLEVQRTVERCKLDLVQLCGNESSEYTLAVGVPVLKVLHIPEVLQRHQILQDITAKLQILNAIGHRVILDSQSKDLPGGTGQVFDWAIARELPGGSKFFLAGGLTPKNVVQAIQEVRPIGVDVSSGVETGGVKDSAKIAQFIDQVRFSDASNSHTRSDNYD